MQNEVKKSIRKKLLTLGTKVRVIGNDELLRKYVSETPGLHNIDETCTDPYEYSGYESDIDEYVDYPDLEDICDLYHGFE